MPAGEAVRNNNHFFKRYPLKHFFAAIQACCKPDFGRAEATKVELLYALTDAIIAYWNYTTLDEGLLQLEGGYNDKGMNHMG
jgi:hypothetical protein